MEEDDKKKSDFERVKAIMGRFDPALLSAALREMMIEADEAEEADVVKAKEAIKGAYDSIPEGKDKKSIVSKAVAELDSDIIEKEVKVIKEKLASVDKETILEAAKDFLDVTYLRDFPCIWSNIKPDCKYIIEKCKNVFIACGSSIFCIYPEGCSFFVCGPSIWDCHYHCLHQGIAKEPGFGIPLPDINPLIKEQLKEEIIQELLEKPELARAVKKMLKKIQDEK